MFVCANVVADVAVVFVNLVMTVVLLPLVLVLVLVFVSEFTQNVLSGWGPKMCTLCLAHCREYMVVLFGTRTRALVLVPNHEGRNLLVTAVFTRAKTGQLVSHGK